MTLRISKYLAFTLSLSSCALGLWLMFTHGHPSYLSQSLLYGGAVLFIGSVILFRYLFKKRDFEAVLDFVIPIFAGMGAIIVLTILLASIFEYAS